MMQNHIISSLYDYVTGVEVGLGSNGRKNRVVWITDGAGWTSAKRNLKETFDVLDTIYNIADMENGVLKTLLL